MKVKPAADVIVTATLVRALLEEQHPDLADGTLAKVAEGWDNAVFRLGHDLAVRLPRRHASAALIRNEQRWLPDLAARLPVPVPLPLRIGVPSDRFKWSWSVVPWLPGDRLLDVPAAPAPRIAADLARFLAALHRPAPIDAPANPWRGVPLRMRTDALHDHLQRVDGVDRTAVLRLWKDALSSPPWPGPPLWLHGDLHPGNLLVGEARLSAVIDFGDLTSGDPATDLAVRWMLPPGLRSAFEAWTGDREALRLRARGWALALAVAFLAHSRGDRMLARLGRETISAVLSDA